MPSTAKGVRPHRHERTRRREQGVPALLWRPSVTAWFPRLLVVTAAVQFIVFAIRPFLSYEALALDASLADLGLVTASFSSLSLLAALPMGRAVDRWGERPFIVMGTAVMALVPIAVAAADTVATLVAASAALGMGHLSASVGIQTLIAKGAIADRRESRFATYTLVNSAGQLVAPATFGLLVGDVVATDGGGEVTNAGRVYVTAGVVGAVGLIMAASLLLRPGALAARPVTARAPSRSSFGEVLRTPSVPVALLASFSTLSAIDLLAAYLPAYGAARGISVRTVGLLLAAHGLASVLVRLAMMRLIVRVGRRRLLTISMLTPALMLGLLPFVTWVPGLYLIMVVSGLGLGLCQPITLGWVAGQVRREIRGTAMSVRLAGNRLGQTVVPLAVGALAGAAGLAAAFVGPAALLAVGGVLVFRARSAGGG
jgi:MFS family permease